MKFLKPMKHNDLVYGYVQGAGLLADISAPDTDGPFPVILSVHGGRWIRGTRRDNGAIDVEQWAGLGFFAMSVEYRLVTCSPAPACYQDILCAIRWVHAHAEQYRLDLSRFFLIGMSSGGHLVALAATLGDGKFPRTGGWTAESHEFTAAICVSGAYDLKKLSWGSGWMPPGEDWASAREYASPIRHVSADSRPMLLLHSNDDPSIPAQQAVSMVDELKNVGAPHKFVHYNDRGHIQITPEVIEEVLKFVASPVVKTNAVI